MKSWVCHCAKDLSTEETATYLPPAPSLSIAYRFNVSLASFQVKFLPPPRRICNRRCLSCLLAALRKHFRTDLHEIFMKGLQWVNEHDWILMAIRWSPSGCRHYFRIRHYWEIRKVVNGHRSIGQMAALVRRALAEVCTVPVLLVLILVHGQVTIIFVVSVGLSVCLSAVCLCIHLYSP